MQVLRDPTPDTAFRFLQGELLGLAQRRGHLVQAVGDCEVHYQGRARSDLHRGERLLLLKPDGTLLVHTAEKSKPVNWQPPGASFSVALADGHVVLTSHRTKPEEIVRVTFHAITLLLAVPLRDGADLALLGTEDDLQKLLYVQPDLVEAGFVPARRERGTSRGYHDLDGRDAQGRRLVVECKRTTAGVAEAQQLWRYVEKLRGNDATTRGILLAPRVADRARKLLADHGLEWKEVDWADILPKVEAMRRGGQASLLRFD
ncbi:MAG TPA: endonuclease NucS [Candidatus Thermoplasmatota archaeon]|nr:endonuclease NucS [Candidatus Thermoplasmatota archaeon]